MRDCRICGKDFYGKKNIINVSSLHNRFRKHYPINYLVFPHIGDSDTPVIRDASDGEKRMLITQVLHSTFSIFRDYDNQEVTKKLVEQLSTLKCLYFDMTSDLERNSEVLRDYLKNSVP